MKFTKKQKKKLNSFFIMKKIVKKQNFRYIHIVNNFNINYIYVNIKRLKNIKNIIKSNIYFFVNSQ